MIGHLTIRPFLPTPWEALHLEPEGWCVLAPWEGEGDRRNRPHVCHVGGRIDDAEARAAAERVAEMGNGRGLPEQPAPVGGEGDVLLDLADHRLVPILTAHYAGLANGKATTAEMRPAGMFRSAMHLSAILCQRLGVDLRAAIRQRREKGIETYGRPLRYSDGRNLGDAAEEAIDLCAYLLRELGPEALR